MKASIAAARQAAAAESVAETQARIERKLDALLLKMGFGLDENGEVIVPEEGTTIPHFAELTEDALTPDPSPEGDGKSKKAK